MNQVVLSGGVGFCNAVRRALLSEIESWAVHQVEVRKNTSCQNDEFLAHRIGQLSFRKVGEGTSLQLHVASRTVLARDITGRAFEVVHPDIEIMYLAPGQEIEMTLFLDKQPAKAHARYSPCAAVGMDKIDGEGRHRISFELNDGRCPKETLLHALDYLDSNLDTALLSLANQPSVPPRSFC